MSEPMTDQSSPSRASDDPLGKLLLSHLRSLPDGSLTRAEVNLLVGYIEELERKLIGQTAEELGRHG